MKFYPEQTNNVSEFWQAGRLLDGTDIDQLQPMWADTKNSPNRHYYVKELAQLKSGEFVIPVVWYTKGGTIHADVLRVCWNTNVSVDL